MAYLPTPRSGRGMPALGGVSDVASAAVNVASDPCLVQVAQLVNRLHKALPTSPTNPDNAPGIGLCSAVRPLQSVAYVAERPWIIPVAVGGVMAILVGVGYMLGKGGGR